MRSQAGATIFGLLAHFFMAARHLVLLVDGLAQDIVLVLNQVVVSFPSAVAHFFVTLLTLLDAGLALFQHRLETLVVTLLHGFLALA